MRKQVRALACPLCWVNSVPPNPHPPESERDFVGKQGLCCVISYNEVLLVPFSEGSFGHRHTQRRGHRTTEAGIGGMLPPAKECEGVPAAHSSWESKEDLSLEPSKGAWPCPHLILHFWPPELGEKKALSFEAP